MLKTYRITPAYIGIGNYRIEAFESGKNTLDIIMNEYYLQGAKEVLEAFGYRLTKIKY